MATTKTKATKVTRVRRSTVSFEELRALKTRRVKSSYPQDARTERLYWIRQINTLLGETTN